MLVLAQKISQIGLHMTVAFAVMFFTTGSLALGGLAALIEPVCVVLLLPLHDRLWSALSAKHRTGIKLSLRLQP